MKPLPGSEFTKHQVVHHGRKEYVREDAYTNTLEGFFSIFKRGMSGVYQHCAEKHLPRYLAEYDFRFSCRASLGYTDDDRAVAAVRGGEGNASPTGNLTKPDFRPSGSCAGVGDDAKADR